MIFVDTSYLLAILDPRDALHDRALDWARHVKEGLLGSEYVLWEVVNACSKPINRPRIQALVAHLRASPQFEIVAASADMFEAGLVLHAERSDKEWSLTDCISFLIMQKLGLTQALTFDLHFEQAGFEALLRHDPDQGNA